MRWMKRLTNALAIWLFLALILHWKTSTGQMGKDRIDPSHVGRSIVDRSIDLGAGAVAGLGAFSAYIAAGVCPIFSCGTKEEWQLLGDLFTSLAAVSWKRMVKEPCCLAKLPDGRWIERSQKSWHQNQAYLEQIPIHSEDGKDLIAFLQRKWLSKANGFYPWEVGWIASHYGIALQVNPETRNSYARDPFTQTSQVYENRLNAWKKMLPHPEHYPLILTRPKTPQEYLPSCVAFSPHESEDVFIQSLSIDKTTLLDLTCALPREGACDWSATWSALQTQLQNSCQERQIPLDQLICMQRIEQNGLGGIRILPLVDQNEELMDRDYRLILDWISRFGLTADIIELDRFSIPENHIQSNEIESVAKIPILPEFSTYVYHDFTMKLCPEKKLMMQGVFKILQHCIEGCKKKEIVLCPTQLAVAQVSMQRIMDQLTQMQSTIDSLSFFDFASHLEEVYANVLPLLEVFALFDFPDFSSIYRNLIGAPPALQPFVSCGLLASGMTGLSGIFKAVAKTLQGKTPVTIYGEHTYFECIDVAKRISKACSEKDARPQDWEEADLLIAQFNPVLRRDNPNQEDYHVENVSQNIRKILSPHRTKPLTVALDATIDFLQSARIQELLQEFESEILEGKLNIACFRSGLKFDLFGMDNYAGSPCFTLHNNSPYWSSFDAFLQDPSLRTDSLSLQWFCLAFQASAQELDLYRKQIFTNTRNLLQRIPQGLLNAKGRYRVVPVAEGVDPSFIDIKVFGPFHKWRAATLVGGHIYLHALKEGHPMFCRRSFGFYHANFGILFGEESSTIRLTLGLDSSEVETILECFKKIELLNRDF